MKRFLIVSFLMSSLLSPCEAQTKMRDVFLQMPDSLLPYLTANNRLDFIDFLDSGMKAGVANELGGKSEMLTLTDTTLTLQASAAKLVQMQLMPVSNPVDSCNQVVCVIIPSDGAESTWLHTSHFPNSLMWHLLHHYHRWQCA